MERILNVTEARSQLPTLVKEVTEKDHQVIISTWKQPKAVIMGYDLFLFQQKYAKMGVKYRFHELIEQAQSLVEATLEGSASGDSTLYLFWRNFGKVMREAWEIADQFSKPHAMLSFQLLGLSERCLAGYGMLEIEHLQPVREVLIRLTQRNLTEEDVAEADLYLLQNSIDARFPMYVDGDLNALYEIQHETDEEADVNYYVDGVESL